MKSVQNETKKTESKVEVSKSVTLEVHEIEKESVIVNVDGWRIRLYFDKSLDEDKKAQLIKGGKVEAKYFGDLQDVHSLKFSLLK